MMRAAARCRIVVVGNQNAFHRAVRRRMSGMVYLVVVGVVGGYTTSGSVSTAIPELTRR